MWLLGWILWPGWGLARSAFAPIATSKLDLFVRELESSYRSVKTVRADFTQTYLWGDKRRVETGEVYFARGGMMRWDYNDPTRKLFLSDGKKLYLYVPEEKQLTRSSVKSSDDIRVPFRLMLSRLSLRKVFSRIEFDNHESKREPDNVVLRAFPKPGHEDEFQEVLMELTPGFDIRRLVIVSNEHSTMEFTFDHIERNVALSLSLFHFVPPPGTEIIEQP